MSNASIDLIVFNNVWNEVVNGFQVENFEASIGITHADAAELLARIHGGSENALNRLTASDIEATARAFKTCITELQWEFPIRVGVATAEAQAVIEKHLKAVGRS
jgi:hypothetical protein